LTKAIEDEGGFTKPWSALSQDLQARITREIPLFVDYKTGRPPDDVLSDDCNRDLRDIWRKIEERPYPLTPDGKSPLNLLVHGNLWDQMDEETRRNAVACADAKHDPALQEFREKDEELLAQIDEMEKAPASTPTDIITKRSELALMTSVKGWRQSHAIGALCAGMR
jgi:hypothetical protein